MTARDTSRRARLELFYDCSSPWTYLAFEGLLRLDERHDFELVWRPILVGGIFNTINPSVYAARESPIPAKVAYAQKDLQDWARLYGISIGSPSAFPVNSVKAMRGALYAIEQGRVVEFSRAVFQTYWGELRDISRDDVLREVAEAVGLDGASVLAAATEQRFKDALRQNTEELVTRGGFGSPTMILDGEDRYFGNDRLQLLEAALARRCADELASPATGGARR